MVCRAGDESPVTRFFHFAEVTRRRRRSRSRERTRRSRSRDRKRRRTRSKDRSSKRSRSRDRGAEAKEENGGMGQPESKTARYDSYSEDGVKHENEDSMQSYGTNGQDDVGEYGSVAE